MKPSTVHVLINQKPYTFEEPSQTGLSLKERAGIAAADVLFRDRPGEDEVIPNSGGVVLSNGDRFHSAPPADYGEGSSSASTREIPQPDGWTFLIFDTYSVGSAYTPSQVELLVKLPPTFPDAQPDMFWVRPSLRTRQGTQPRGTSMETIAGLEWQRFSWHLAPGAWRPGVSSLRDYMRCVRARFERED